MLCKTRATDQKEKKTTAQTSSSSYKKNPLPVRHSFCVFPLIKKKEKENWMKRSLKRRKLVVECTRSNCIALYYVHAISFGRGELREREKDATSSARWSASARRLWESFFWEGRWLLDDTTSNTRRLVNEPTWCPFSRHLVPPPPASKWYVSSLLTNVRKLASNSFFHYRFYSLLFSGNDVMFLI